MISFSLHVKLKTWLKPKYSIKNTAYAYPYISLPCVFWRCANTQVGRQVGQPIITTLIIDYNKPV